MQNQHQIRCILRYTNDLAFRYDTTTIAIILGDTAEKEATTAAKEPETTTAPAEEPKPKKRKWFGRKSGDEK